MNPLPSQKLPASSPASRPWRQIERCAAEVVVEVDQSQQEFREELAFLRIERREQPPLNAADFNRG
jgi:hypothetical protein